MEISEFMKKSAFGSRNAESTEAEKEMENSSVSEAEPEVEVPAVTETEPESPSVPETEPVAEAEIEVPVVTEETETETEAVSETEQKEETSALAETVEEECKSVTQNCITAEQISAVVEETNKSVLSEISELKSSLKDINARVSSLRKLADMHQEIENNLNNQINEYKDNLYRRIVNPILVEFFDIQEDMNSEALEATEETAKILTEYVGMIMNVLKHYGVTVDTVSVGDVYDTRIHKPAKVIQTDDKSLDRTIAKTRKTLVHSIDGKVVERANVHVYQYQEPKVQAVVEEPVETPSEPAEISSEQTAE